MSSSKKELPNARKRVTASGRARTFVKKSKRGATSELDGSYVQRVKKTVTTVDVVKQQMPANHSDNEAILSMLRDIKDSNEALWKRMDKDEQHTVCDSTPINPRSHAFDQMGNIIANFTSASYPVGRLG